MATFLRIDSMKQMSYENMGPYRWEGKFKLLTLTLRSRFVT